MRRYEAYGLRVDSEIDLTLRRRSDVWPADVTFRRGQECHAIDVPPGTRIARLRDPARPDQTLFEYTRDHARLRFAYPGLCEWVSDEKGRDFTATLQNPNDSGFLSVLGSAAVLAGYLTINEHLVLHASAVRVGDEAVAFVGSSGMGKSTLATLFCMDGSPLITDDLLRVEMGQDGERPEVFGGVLATRLRPAAKDLGSSNNGRPWGYSADGRITTTPPVDDSKSLPLRCCVIPLPSRTEEEVQVTRLSTSGALRRLLQFPRLLGCTDPSLLRTTFQLTADLAQRVPVFEARLPWGPPFPDGIARRLAAQLPVVRLSDKPTTAS